MLICLMQSVLISQEDGPDNNTELFSFLLRRSPPARRAIGLVMFLGCVLAACGSPPPAQPVAAPADPDQLYKTQGIVLETQDHQPELCLGTIEESYPPQCQGIAMDGWDWGEVEGEEEAGGSIWGEFHLVGRYDGETFDVHEVRPPEPPVEREESDSIGTPCMEPAGGWVATDPARASQEDVVEIQRHVSDDPEFVGLWIDYYNEPPGGPTEEDPGDIILNVSFTGDLESHEQELDEMWGGPLCVTEGGKTYKELREIQRTFDLAEFGLEGLWSDIDVTQNVVLFGVVVADDVALEQIEERYGPGVVKIYPRLTPVD